MSADIEKLIERLRATRVDVYAGPEAADALTRLVAPLPAEVADAEYGLRIYCGDVQCDCVCMRTARLLESLAQKNARLAAENDRLRTELAECQAQNRAMAETMSAFAKLDAKEG